MYICMYNPPDVHVESSGVPQNVSTREQKHPEDPLCSVSTLAFGL